MRAGLPHHRRGPRIDERRTDPGDDRALRTGAVVLYVIGVLLLAFFAAGIL